MPPELAAPEYAVLTGALLYAHRTSVTRAAENSGLRAKLRAIFAGSI
jgi:cell division protein FtsA